LRAQAPQDVAPRRVGKRTEHGVEFCMFNHVVEYIAVCLSGQAASVLTLIRIIIR
jgi:hypothetical protein